jgi:hypothetical protein
MSASRQLAEIAARQYGLITTGQLRELGIDREQRRQLVANGLLRSVRRSVYHLAGAPPSWERTVLAAVLAAGPGGVASHPSAGAVWALKHCDPAPRAIYVSAPRQVRLAGVTTHWRNLENWTQCTHRGIPVTTPEQTILDLAVNLTATELGECIDDALRRRLIRLDRLRRLVEARGNHGRRLLQPLRQALADRIPGYDPGSNDWEHDMDQLWDKLGLPPAVRQHRVRANGHTYWLDRAIPHLKIGIEWNGFEYHGTRSGFDRDSDRRADLAAAGWHMLDFTSRSSPDRICRTVLAVVNQRRAQTQPPDEVARTR